MVLGEPCFVKRGDATSGPEALQAGTHDSVICDLEAQRGTFREFIIFDQAQVYPEYVLLYERISEAEKRLLDAGKSPTGKRGIAKAPLRWNSLLILIHRPNLKMIDY